MSPRFWQTLLAAELPPQKSRALLRGLGSRFDDPSSILASSLLTKMEAQRAGGADHRALERAMAEGVQLIHEEDFPSSLLELENRPAALFAWGDWSVVHRRTVGIVGTRGASTYGKAVATKFAEALGRAGVTVVSGGALGIDAAAHKGALSVGGKTVAVLAGGVDRVYPAIHRSLFDQIRANGGCLISQFAVGAPPNDYKFLMRNRIIAAISEALLVIEAPLRSGSLSTANAANEFGRDVYVVPANIDNLKFAGSHSLIRDGATLVDHPDQILEQMGVEGVAKKEESQVPLTEDSEKILGVLNVQPLAPEFIVERTGLDAATVMSELTILEIEGRVLRDAGGYAIRP